MIRSTSLRWVASWNPDLEWFVHSQLVVDGNEVVKAGTGIKIGDVLIRAEPSEANAWWTSLQYLRHVGGVWYLQRWDGTSSVEAWSDDGTFLGAAPNRRSAFVGWVSASG